MNPVQPCWKLGQSPGVRPQQEGVDSQDPGDELGLDLRAERDARDVSGQVVHVPRHIVKHGSNEFVHQLLVLTGKKIRGPASPVRRRDV